MSSEPAVEQNTLDFRGIAPLAAAARGALAMGFCLAFWGIFLPPFLKNFPSGRIVGSFEAASSLNPKP